MEYLMAEIMDLADEKFETDDDLCSDSIHLGIHESDDGWHAWLERPTRKHIKKFGDEAMGEGDVMELETWCAGDGDTLEDALNEVLEILQETEMRRGSGNRLVPVIEE